jgi:hypothetical protein
VSVALFDVPARKVVERRRALEIGGSKIECRVVPRAANRLANDESVGERSAIVRTLASHRVAASVDASDDKRLVTDASSDEPTLGDESGRNADG